MTIFVVQKVSKEIAGEIVFAACEKAFKDKEQAESYAKLNGCLWEENINGFHCQCERGICELELE